MNYKIRKGEKILHNIEKILLDFEVYFKDSAVFYGYKISKDIYMNYFSKFKGFQIKGGSIEEKERVKKILKDFGFSIGIGGGKILDTVKLASGELNIPFISVPSTLSNDGIFSPVSVLKEKDTVKSIITNPPYALIIDYDVIADSPKELLLSGFGDLVSNLSALNDWKLASLKGKAELNEDAYAISLNGALRILNTKADLNSIKFLKELGDGLIDSGIAMRITNNSRPASGSEHLVSHALDRILKKPKRHGIQCGFSTILTLSLHKDEENLKIILRIFKSLGFPKNFKDISIKADIFKKAVLVAPSIRPERYTILNEIKEEEINKEIEALYIDG